MRLLDEIATHLQALPAELANVVRDLLLRPHLYRDSAHICRVAQTPRRSCDRWMLRSGLSSLRRVVQASRALWSTTLLRYHESTLRDAATRVGAHSAKQLSRDIRAVVGVNPFRARRLANDELVARAKRHVTTLTKRGSEVP